MACTTAPAQAIRSSDALDRMVRYLQNDQNEDGGFGGEPGQESTPAFTAWVALALAAAGVNPRDQRRPEKGAVTAYDYLTKQAAEKLTPSGGRESATTEFERELLLVDATGTSPHDFGGVDLVGKILEREIPEPVVGGAAFPHEYGSSSAGVNDTIFAVLALSPVREPAAEAAVQEGATWLEREQNKDGSWPTLCPKTRCREGGEADMTAAAIEALNAAGHHGTTAEAAGLEYLHRVQDSTEGGFAEFPGESQANIGSTAWVVQAIWSAGENPENWKPGGVDPLSYIEAMQQADGHVRWKRSQELNGVWMTAYSGPAMAGVPLPIPAPAYLPLPPEEPEAPSGSGGEGVQSGSGVGAGGGGEGAPLFSRPQRGSKGHTPGGARVLASKASRKKRAQHRRRNPGPPRRRPAPTLEHEVVDGREAASRHGAAGRHEAEADHGASRKHGDRSALSVPATATVTAPAAGGREVKGIPIGSPSRGLLKPGAPGLHGAGRSPTAPTLAITIAALALTLALAGAAIERSRPQVIP